MLPRYLERDLPLHCLINRKIFFRSLIYCTVFFFLSAVTVDNYLRLFIQKPEPYRSNKNSVFRYYFLTVNLTVPETRMFTILCQKCASHTYLIRHTFVFNNEPYSTQIGFIYRFIAGKNMGNWTFFFWEDMICAFLEKT